MPVDNKAVLELVARTKEAIKQVKTFRDRFVEFVRGMRSDADKVSFDKAAESAGKLKTGLGELKGLLVGLGTAAAAIGLKRVIDDSIEALVRQENAIAQVEARLRSTGGAAGLTSKELQDLAASMQDVTTFGDEAVLEAEALLLTFTKIGKETFPGATEATLNMAQAMGTDLKSAALQVGKALNDPVLGVTALSRAGVQFTKDQREVLKALVDTGKTAEAQAIILRELETQMGGAARAARETLGGSLQALQNLLGDLQEQFAAGFATQLRDGLDQTAESAKKTTEGIRALGQAVGFIITIVTRAAGVVSDFGKRISTLGFETDTQPAIEALGVGIESISKRLENLGEVGEGELKRLTGVLLEFATQLQEAGGASGEVGDKVIAVANELVARFEALGASAPASLRNLSTTIEQVKEELGGVQEAAPPAGTALEEAGKKVATAGEQAAKAEQQLRDLRVELQGGSDKAKELSKTQADLAEEVDELQSKTELTVEESNRLFEAQGELFSVTADLRKETERYQAELFSLSQSQQQAGIDAALLVEQMKATGYSFDSVGDGAIRASGYFEDWNQNVKDSVQAGEALKVVVEGGAVAIGKEAALTKTLNEAQREQLRTTLEGLQSRQGVIASLEQQGVAEEALSEKQKEASKTQAEGIAEVNNLIREQISLLQELAKQSEETKRKVVQDFKDIAAAAEPANEAIAA